jgi:hypothetical protein
MSSYLSTIMSRRNANNRTSDDSLLGLIGHFPDVIEGRRLAEVQSGAHVICRLVKNGSGGDLDIGKSVQYLVGSEMKEVDAYSGAGTYCDGIVDPDSGEATVADDEHFLVVIGGVARGCIVGATTHAAGTAVKTGAAGILVASSVDPTTAGYVGIVQTTTTVSGTAIDVLIDCRESVNATNQH